MNWPLGTSHQEPRGRKRRRLSVSKRGQTRGAGPQGSPEQVSEGHWNRRTGVKRDPEVGEEAETPARRGRGAGNRSAETDRAGVPEGPSPRRQTSDKKFQTLTASFQEPEMENKTKDFITCVFFFFFFFKKKVLLEVIFLKNWGEGKWTWVDKESLPKADATLG